MRLALLVLFFVFSLQIASAQENTHSVITVENAQYLTPLYTINEDFFVASFSQFEHGGTAVLLVDSEYNESEKKQHQLLGLGI